MADNISNIVDPAVFGDLDKLIDKIINVENEVDKASSKAISIQVDLKGADTLQSLNESVKDVQVAIQQLNTISRENNTIVQQSANVAATYGDNVSGLASVLAAQKMELSAVNKELSFAIKNHETYGAESVDLSDKIADLTLKQQQLKLEVSATTSAIKTEIKEINAAAGSMDELSQTLLQLKERYRALSAEQRNNAEVGGALQQRIAALDTEIKALDATIGNNQRSVGNYANGFKSLSAELSATKAQMQQMVVAGEKGSAEYAALSARAKELAASQREVSAETGRAVFSIENATRRIETMFFRMAIHFVAFAIIIKTLEAIGDAWEKYSDRMNVAAESQAEVADNLNNSFQKEATSLSILKERFEAVGATMEDKREVVKLLNDEIKDQYGAINSVSDAEKFFEQKSGAFIKALTLRAEAQANLTLLTKEYEEQAKLQANPEQTIGTAQKVSAGFIATGKTIKGLFGRGAAQGTPKEIYDWEIAELAATRASNDLGASYDKQSIYLKNMIRLQREAANIDVANKFHTEDVDKSKNPKVKDTIKSKFSAELKDEEAEYEKHLAKLQ